VCYPLNTECERCVYYGLDYAYLNKHYNVSKYTIKRLEVLIIYVIGTTLLYKVGGIFKWEC
jgi:hypothetical protein